MKPVSIIATIILALGAVEATAYWWMHPAPAGLGQPVLIYQPGSGNRGLEIVDDLISPPLDPLSAIPDPQSSSPSTLNHQPSTSSTPSPISESQPFSVSAFHSTTTPLPAVVENALPSLRCSTGTAARIDREDDVTIHVAFFEWDLSSSTSVLEAFKHLPEECMGSIGMTLIEKAPPRSFVVRGREEEVRGQGTEKRSQRTEVRGQEEATAQGSPSSSNQQSSINNLSRHSAAATDHQSEIFSTAEALSFDHTVFRDQGGVIIHAFKGTWVSGANKLLGEGVRGGVEQWTQIRWSAALKRFRPAHARVVQGAVRGIRDPDLAWEAFEGAMLKDLSFQ